jgi:hypothetical protein
MAWPARGPSIFAKGSSEAEALDKSPAPLPGKRQPASDLDGLWEAGTPTHAPQGLIGLSDWRPRVGSYFSFTSRLFSRRLEDSWRRGTPDRQ